MNDHPPRALLVAAGVWLCLPLAAPVSTAAGWTSGSWIQLFFSPVCHQLPERSFALFGHPAAVCHRCFGLYLGLVLGLLLLPAWARLREALCKRPALIVWFAVPMLIDVVAPFDAWPIRLVTGALAGFPVALVLWLASEEISAMHATREGET